MTTTDPRESFRERCYQFGLSVVQLVSTLPHTRSAWIIGDQVMRSATSIGANMVEAKGSSSRLEFKKFYQIALKSANETQYWLRLLKDAGLVDAKKITPLADEVGHLCRMLGASVIKLKQKP